jgi:hypothetical protein
LAEEFFSASAVYDENSELANPFESRLEKEKKREQKKEKRGKNPSPEKGKNTETTSGRVICSYLI